MVVNYSAETSFLIASPENLVIAASSEGGGVVTEVDALHDVLVLKSQLLLPGERVPHLGREVRGPGGGLAGVLVDVHAPHRPLVTLECPDPVSRVTSSQHRLS